MTDRMTRIYDTAKDEHNEHHEGPFKFCSNPLCKEIVAWLNAWF